MSICRRGWSSSKLHFTWPAIVPSRRHHWFKDAWCFFDFECRPHVIQVAIHAIGDRAVDELLAIHRNIPTAASQPRLPHRIEHAQHLSGQNATDLLSRTGLHAVVNPQHLLTDRGIMLQQLGEARSGHGHSFAYSSMLQVTLKSHQLIGPTVALGRPGPERWCKDHESAVGNLWPAPSARSCTYMTCKSISA